ncbi:MAG: zinc-dependent peptidase [Polyangiaceae bacterium]|nr:zinc-dependent peptidase [Polyangiaceae bacterium]
MSRDHRVFPKRAALVHRSLALLLTLVACIPIVLVFESVPALLLAPVIGGVYYLVSTRRYRRRARIAARPFPSPWRDVLLRRVPFYRGLGEVDRPRFELDVALFLSEQRIIGDHGATVDDETRVLIAASAAMLAFGMPEWEWDDLRDIVVYPRAFDDGYRQSHDAQIAGMVHHQGPILLSQRDVKLGFAKQDGHNVALHELAHVMDFADGRADGIPADIDWVATAPWIELVSNRLERVRRAGKYRALRSYAGTNEAELFAVAVEAFFERPAALKERDPDLYAALADYFNQDPAG